MRRGPIVAVCAVAAVAATLGTPAISRADPPLSVQPDADPHGYCYSGSVGYDAHINIRLAAGNALDEPTDANVNFDAECQLSGDGETDVVWFIGNLADNVQGSTHCEDFDNGRCDQWYTTRDMQEIAVGDHDEIDETQTACHELGHTVGLRHGPRKRDCMITGRDTPPTALKYRRYSRHHRVDHINEWF